MVAPHLRPPRVVYHATLTAYVPPLKNKRYSYGLTSAHRGWSITMSVRKGLASRSRSCSSGVANGTSPHSTA